MSCESFEAELAKGPAAAFTKALDTSARFMEQITEAAEQIAQRRELWDCTCEWRLLTSDWFACSLADLNIRQAQTETTKHILACERMDRLLPSNDAVPALFALIQHVQTNLPFLSHLRNTDLRGRHWAAINAECDDLDQKTVEGVSA